VKFKHGHLKQTVEVLRIDGTPWRIEHAKHVLFREHDIFIYLGEHSADRKLVIIPRHRIDHLNLIEEVE